eukprot:TRINITY_DN146_c2_g4_i1.p1 TRINITY_DN146_c2_g4~~TRINITY_DN146_c2_g4_i1.p1  ORF type:complete len:1854 (-),score=518.73 TRINITY_DN146_c2_g4_i1:66-5477(-)
MDLERVGDDSNGNGNGNGKKTDKKTFEWKQWIPSLGNVGLQSTLSFIRCLRLSSCGQYLAALDANGSLTILSWGKGKEANLPQIAFSASIFSDKRHDLEHVLVSTDDQIENVSFWGDSGIVIARQSGRVEVRLFENIGRNLLHDSDVPYSGKQLSLASNSTEKQFFMAASLPKESDKGGGSHGFGPDDGDGEVIGDGYQSGFFMSEMQGLLTTFRLFSFSETTPKLLYERRIERGEYEEALSLADQFMLDADIVFKHKWKHSRVTVSSIQETLSQISDKWFVVEECLRRTAHTPMDQDLLLEFGLSICSELSKKEDIEKVQAYRNRLLIYREMLSSYDFVYLSRDEGDKSSFDRREYMRIRNGSVVDWAKELSLERDMVSLKRVYERHRHEITGHEIELMGLIATSTPPKEYTFLMHGLHDADIFVARAEQIERETGNLDDAMTIVMEGLVIFESDEKLQYLRKELEELIVIVYERRVLHMSLRKYRTMSDMERFCVLVDEESVQKTINNIRSLHYDVKTLVAYLEKKAKDSFPICVSVFFESQPTMRDTRLIKDDAILLKTILKCVYACSDSKTFLVDMNAILEYAPQRPLDSSARKEILDLHDQLDLMETHITVLRKLRKFDVILQMDFFQRSNRNWNDVIESVLDYLCRSSKGGSCVPDAKWKSVATEMSEIRDVLHDETFPTHDALHAMFLRRSLLHQGWEIAAHFGKSVPKELKQSEYLRSAIHFFESSKTVKDPLVQSAWKCLNEMDEIPAVRKEKNIIEACQLMSKHLETIIPAHIRQADLSERTSILKQYCTNALQVESRATFDLIAEKLLISTKAVTSILNELLDEMIESEDVEGCLALLPRMPKDAETWRIAIRMGSVEEESLDWTIREKILSKGLSKCPIEEIAPVLEVVKSKKPKFNPLQLTEIGEIIRKSIMSRTPLEPNFTITPLKFFSYGLRIRTLNGLKLLEEEMRSLPREFSIKCILFFALSHVISHSSEEFLQGLDHLGDNTVDAMLYLFEKEFPQAQSDEEHETERMEWVQFIRERQKEYWKASERGFLVRELGEKIEFHRFLNDPTYRATMLDARYQTIIPVDENSDAEFRHFLSHSMDISEIEPVLSRIRVEWVHENIADSDLSVFHDWLKNDFTSHSPDWMTQIATCLVEEVFPKLEGKNLSRLHMFFCEMIRSDVDVPPISRRVAKQHKANLDALLKNKISIDYKDLILGTSEKDDVEDVVTSIVNADNVDTLCRLARRWIRLGGEKITITSSHIFMLLIKSFITQRSADLSRMIETYSKAIENEHLASLGKWLLNQVVTGNRNLSESIFIVRDILSSCREDADVDALQRILVGMCLKRGFDTERMSKDALSEEHGLPSLNVLCSNAFEIERVLLLGWKSMSNAFHMASVWNTVLECIANVSGMQKWMKWSIESIVRRSLQLYLHRFVKNMMESFAYPLDFISEDVALSWDLGEQEPSKHVVLQVEELLDGKLLPRLKHSVLGDLAEFINRVSQFPIRKIDVPNCFRVASLTKLVLQHGEGIDGRMIENIHLLFSWNAILRKHFAIEVSSRVFRNTSSLIEFVNKELVPLIEIASRKSEDDGDPNDSLVLLSMLLSSCERGAVHLQDVCIELARRLIRSHSDRWDLVESVFWWTDSSLSMDDSDIQHLVSSCDSVGDQFYLSVLSKSKSLQSHTFRRIFLLALEEIDRVWNVRLSHVVVGRQMLHHVKEETFLLDVIEKHMYETFEQKRTQMDEVMEIVMLRKRFQCPKGDAIFRAFIDQLMAIGDVTRAHQVSEKTGIPVQSSIQIPGFGGFLKKFGLF